MSELFGSYMTKKFTDIFPSYDKFQAFYSGECAIPLVISEDSLKTLFYLLYARYGNDHIAQYDENQFKYLMGSIIFQWGPTWEKRLDVQKTLRNLSEEDIVTGARQIYNHAENPQTAPSTQTLEELDFINEQNVNKYKKGKLDAYLMLNQALKTDVTENFLIHFKVCFLYIVAPQQPLWYVTPIDGADGSTTTDEYGPNFCV